MEYIDAKTILTKCKSTEWFGTDYNMNIYRGCCHGCIYCDSRSECYNIDNFDKVRAKKDVLPLLRDELKRKVRSGVIGTGAMSDPYNPFEKELQLTRHSLELIDAFNFGISIVTKSALITRDIDILQNIKEHSPVICKLTITAADDSLCRKIEPHVSLSSERFEAMHTLSNHGIFSGEIRILPGLPVFRILRTHLTHQQIQCVTVSAGAIDHSRRVGGVDGVQNGDPAILIAAQRGVRDRKYLILRTGHGQHIAKVRRRGDLLR